MRRLTLFTALLVLLLTGACGSDDDSSDDSAGDTTEETSTPEIRAVSVEAKDYSYVMPAEVEAGTIEFTMENTGNELHIAALGRIKDGKTFDDVTKAMQSPTPPPEPLADEIGGIASTNPGLSSIVTLELEPGSYYFACFIPSADGAPHVAKGMVQSFEVTDSETEPAEMETAAGTVTAKDFGYETTYKVAAGEQIIELANSGAQGHEITLLEFAPGKGPADLSAFFEKPEGPPPATFFGGPVIKPGSKANWKTPAMQAGKSYFFMCLIPDPADGVPHAAKGMVLPIQVT